MLETEEQIVDGYVKTGRARLVYRHLMQLGSGSRALAEASECAGAQGKFWEMRELIYRRQRDLRGQIDLEKLRPLATDLGLDGERFDRCFEQHEFQQQVDADYAAAQEAGVHNRPVLEIDGQRIIGAQPFARYQQAFEGGE